MKKSFHFLTKCLKAFIRFTLFKPYAALSSFFFILFFTLAGWMFAYHYYHIATAVPLISNDALMQEVPQSQSNAPQLQTVSIKHGDTLPNIFQKNNLSHQELLQIMSLGKSVHSLTKLKAGQKLLLLLSPDQKVQQLALESHGKNILIVTKKDNQYVLNAPIISTPQNTANKQTQTTNDVHYGHAIIQKSLYDSGIASGLTRSQAMQLVSLFGQNNNLAKNIRRNDQLEVLFYPKTNYLLLAQLTHRGKTYRIFRFTDPKGKTDYYTDAGINLHPPIIRAPLNYSHISSRFSVHRWEPILHFFRPHYGVDYAASTGTPVKAAGDGYVYFAGPRGGFGNVVMIKHPNNFQTVYAHLSRFAKGIHYHAQVKQGQVIGYVGDTGLSTGSHLHFEIHVNNVPKNPLSVTLPNGSPVLSQYKKLFNNDTQALLAQLNLHEKSVE